MNSSSTTTTRRPSALQAGSTLAAIVALTAIGGSVLAAPFTSFTQGDIVVSRLGDGAALPANGTGAAIFLDEYTTSGAFVGTLSSPISTTDTTGLVDSYTAGSEGALTLSADGKYLTIVGYHAAIGTTGVAAAAGLTRGVALINAAGVVDVSTSLTQASTYGANNIRSAVTTNGTDLFLTGTSATGATGTAGVRTAVVGGTTSTQLNNGDATPTTNTRVANLFGGDLYFSTGTGTQGIYKVGTGASTTTGQTTALTAADPAGSPYDFFFANATTLFVADDRTSTTATGAGGLLKYVNSGSGFTLTNTYNLTGTTTGTTAGLRGLTGSATDLFAISSDNRLVDFNLGSTSFTTLATAATNTNFRGVDFAPSAAVPEASSSLSLGALLALGLAAGVVARRKRTAADAS